MVTRCTCARAQSGSEATVCRPLALTQPRTRSHPGCARRASLSQSRSAARGCDRAPHPGAHICLHPSPRLLASATAGCLDHGTTDI